MSPGSIIILSGPSGSGKTTLYKRLLASTLKRQLVRSISMTTRPRRKGERHGRDYIFVSQDEFVSKIGQKHFLEWQKVFDFYYGTPRAEVQRLLESGKNVLLCIDVKGAEVISKEFPGAIKIFVRTPNLKILKERLVNRKTESAEVLKTRLQTAKEELKHAKHYQYSLVNNNLPTAAKDLKNLVGKILKRKKAA